VEEERLKNDKGPMDFSNYIFDNTTGKPIDIKSDFRLSAMAELAK
jgi:hypothetical protein